MVGLGVLGCLAAAAGVASPWPTWDGSLDGSPVAFNSNLVAVTSITNIDANTVIGIYEDAGGSDFGRAVVGTISDTAITWGATVVFSGTGTISNSAVAVLSSSQVIIAYRDTGDTNKGKAVILDISGTNITVNTVVTFETDAINAISVAMLSSSKAVVTYNDTTASKGKSMVLDVASSAITTNTAFAFAPSSTAPNCVVAAISSTQVLVVYQDSNNSFYGTAQVLDISGSTLTGNTSYVFNSNSSSLFRIANIKSGIFAIVYKNAGDSNFSNVQILSLAGTVVSYGSPVRVINLVPSDGFFAITKADSQNAFIFYRDVTTSRGAARVASISGTAITMQTPVAVTSTHTAQAMSVTNLDNKRVLYIYRDQTNGSFGTGKVSKAA